MRLGRRTTTRRLPDHEPIESCNIKTTFTLSGQGSRHLALETEYTTRNILCTFVADEWRNQPVFTVHNHNDPSIVLTNVVKKKYWHTVSQQYNFYSINIYWLSDWFVCFTHNTCKNLEVVAYFRHTDRSRNSTDIVKTDFNSSIICTIM